MNIHIFTIGFTQKSAEQFFTLLAEAGVARVMDVRENRAGQLFAFAQERDLRYFLPRLIGAEYEIEPLLAPSPEIRTAYKTTKDWSAYERSFAELLQSRRVAELISPDRFAQPTALLCSEPTPEKCHRRLVAEFFAALWRPLGHEVEITHLALPKPGRSRKRTAAKAGEITVCK